MNLFRNKYVVVGLTAAAGFLMFRSLRPLWQRPGAGGPVPAPPPTAPAAAAVKNAVPAASPPAPRGDAKGSGAARPREAKASLKPEEAIDLARAGWLYNATPRRDPFQLVQLDAAAAPRLYPAASEVLTLMAVWWQSGNIVAVINSNVVSEGESLRGFGIRHIGLERVWLDGPSGPEEIEFDPTLTLRGISVNLGKAFDNSFAVARTRLDWPFRVVGGATNDIASSLDWHPVGGKIVQKLGPGRYLASFDDDHRPAFVAKDQVVMLLNLPLALVDGDPLPPVVCKFIGSDTYESVVNGPKTVRAFDFGIPCTPPAEAVDLLKIQKAFLSEQNRAANAARLKLDRREAEQGSASAQYILGRRYLYGDGVPRDAFLARQWLGRAAAQGNRDAQATLLLLAYEK